MAKLKTDTEETAGGEKDQAPDTTITQEQVPKESKTIPSVASKTKNAVIEIPDYADAKLKVYSSYKSLYIDSHGGTYTSNTPEKSGVTPFYTKTLITNNRPHRQWL